MAILINLPLGAPLNGTNLNANFTTIEASLLDAGPFIVSGLVPSIGTGLSVNVTSGVASIGGRVTAGAFVIGSLTPSTTNHLYMTNAGAGTSNTTGTQPANTVKLGTCVTGVATVTSVDITAASGRQTKLAIIVPQGALTQTYSTADATLSAYTPNVQSSAYTGAADTEAKLADLNSLRVGYENLRLFCEDLAQLTNSLIDKLQAAGIIG